MTAFISPRTKDLWTVIGLMSGTSMDGMDVALLETDGKQTVRPLDHLTLPYQPEFRARLRDCLRDPFGDAVSDVAQALTRLHARAVEAMLQRNMLLPSNIDVVGFHGHTIYHAPDAGVTLQIGDGRLLADEIGIDVVSDFRAHDVANGGQGAPFAPVYHQALAATLSKPLMVLNIGGVANLTWLGPGVQDIIAFDTGPGNALVDDWVFARTGAFFDNNGEIAATGVVDNVILQRLMQHPYFDLAPPKSLDRLTFDLHDLIPEEMAVADGAATLTAFTAEAVVRALEVLPDRPMQCLVTGGGRLNKTMMKELAVRLDMPVRRVENAGWNGDFLEAECFGYLAVRARQGLPLSYPTTTGVAKPLGGGVYHPFAEDVGAVAALV